MVRRSDFEQTLASIFAIIVFFMIASIILKDLPDPTGIANLIKIIFIVGAFIAVIGLIQKLIDLFK